MNKPLYCFIGKSGSGKTTIARMLENRSGYKQLCSYTTREQRDKEDVEHIFVSTEEFNQLQDLVAYTEYNGNKYGATNKQVDDADIYVVNPPGVEELLQKYKNRHRTIFVIYFDTTVYTRINRMLDRHDSDMQIVSRLLQDEKTDWKDELIHIICKSPNSKNVLFSPINANGSVEGVYQQVLNCMEHYED